MSISLDQLEKDRRANKLEDIQTILQLITQQEDTLPHLCCWYYLFENRLAPHQILDVHALYKTLAATLDTTFEFTKLTNSFDKIIRELEYDISQYLTSVNATNPLATNAKKWDNHDSDKIIQLHVIRVIQPTLSENDILFYKMGRYTNFSYDFPNTIKGLNYRRIFKIHYGIIHGLDDHWQKILKPECFYAYFNRYVFKRFAFYAYQASIANAAKELLLDNSLQLYKQSFIKRANLENKLYKTRFNEDHHDDPDDTVYKEEDESSDKMKFQRVDLPEDKEANILLDQIADDTIYRMGGQVYQIYNYNKFNATPYEKYELFKDNVRLLDGILMNLKRNRTILNMTHKDIVYYCSMTEENKVLFNLTGKRYDINETLLDFDKDPSSFMYPDTSVNNYYLYKDLFDKFIQCKVWIDILGAAIESNMFIPPLIMVYKEDFYQNYLIKLATKVHPVKTSVYNKMYYYDLIKRANTQNITLNDISIAFHETVYFTPVRPQLKRIQNLHSSFSDQSLNQFINVNIQFGNEAIPTVEPVIMEEQSVMNPSVESVIPDRKRSRIVFNPDKADELDDLFSKVLNRGAHFEPSQQAMTHLDHMRGDEDGPYNNQSIPQREDEPDDEMITADEASKLGDYDDVD